MLPLSRPRFKLGAIIDAGSETNQPVTQGVWVNPRVAARGFAPVTGGMAAALPYVDELISGHSLAALDALVEAIGRHR